MKKALMIMMTFCAFGTYAQEVDLAKGQLNANILPLTLSYEGRIDDNKSFTLSAGLGFTGYFESNNGDTDSYFFAVPVFTGSVRNYYTRKNVKKDNLRSNSGNYIGLYGTYQLEPFGSPSSLTEAKAYAETTNVFTVGPVWGIERNYASGIHLGLSMGIGMMGGKNIDLEPAVIGEFEFGFVLFSKK